MKNNKALGQHWLTNRPILNAIADYAQSSDTPPKQQIPLCLEIGPGLGTLTSSLLKRFNQVLAIELDQRLAQNLPQSFPGKNLTVVNQDFLSFNLSQIQTPYVVAGNIPYYISTPIIKHLLSAPNPPAKIVLLVQKEFAFKILNHTTPFAYYVQNLAEPAPGPVVKKDFFTPPPKFDSAILILTPRKQPLYSPHTTPTLAEIERLITLAFSSPRKKLSSTIPELKTKLNSSELSPALKKNPISSDSRPADLSLRDYATLAQILKS